MWCGSSVRRLATRVPHLAVGLSASTQSFSLFPSNSFHFGWILVLIRPLVHFFFFRFVDEFVPAFIHFRKFASCNRSLHSLFYSLSFSLRFFFLVRCSWLSSSVPTWPIFSPSVAGLDVSTPPSIFSLSFLMRFSSSGCWC